MCKCKVCKRQASEIGEYLDGSSIEGLSISDYVKTYEGTYDSSSDSFICTDCYIRIGQPSNEELMEMKFD